MFRLARTAYDAIDVDNLPSDGDLYLGYDDGNWPDADAIAEKFPGKTVVRITVNPNDNKGVIGDGPPDNGTWPQWVGWVVKRRAAGEDPWINTNQSSWATAKAAFATAQIDEPHWWIAHYDNDPSIPDGALMKQYASNSKFDTSSCSAYLPGIDPKPVVSSVTTTFKEDDLPQQIEPLSVHPGEYAYDIPTGAFQVRFGCDGYNALAKLRIVFWTDSNNSPAVHDGIQLGGDKRYSGLEWPKGSTHITVKREDTGNFPISVGFA